ncbi:hypothetical protein GCM10011391_07440 [Pullulanibacillus camelliae]|uniref:TNase-like domain-containing protein n=1 Tax=Pullulanibacillus camelliae TaxID=1707096 RepID=A0A8J2VLM8_9BACL|nr:thermonuclease family protein [Pullulanibacillus camelliae]GGE31278.1 hypothetical protein GCM10011391_07440 [Pullulanibacillus camelliae]
MRIVVGMIMLILFLILLFKFPLILIGLGLLIWGVYELTINKKLKAKSLMPLIVLMIGLGVGISGIAVAASGSSNSHKVSSTKQHKAHQKTESVQTTSTKAKPSNSDKTTPVKQASTKQSKDKKTSIPSYLVTATVSKDVDGDTIHVNLKGKDEPVRMLLIDTPETHDARKPVEPYGPQASKYAQEKLPVGKKIYLQLGKKGAERDKYNRLLAYVYLTPKDMYNLDVVKKGLARVAYVYEPNTAYLSDLKAAQDEAKSKHLGIWSMAGYVSKNGYSLTKSCSWAKSNGYSTAGCSAATQTKKSSTRSTATLTTQTKQAVTKSSPKTRTQTASTVKKHSTPTKKSSTPPTVTGSLDVSHGQMASVTVKTSPGTSGTIAVYYNSGPSTAQGLTNKTAGSDGTITWTWKVGTRTSPGRYKVEIHVAGKSINKTLVVH